MSLCGLADTDDETERPEGRMETGRLIARIDIQKVKQVVLPPERMT